MCSRTSRTVKEDLVGDEDYGVRYLSYANDN